MTGPAARQSGPACHFGTFDAVLAAAARAAGADAVVSAGTGFSRIAAIHHVIPDADGIRHLLGTSEE